MEIVLLGTGFPVPHPDRAGPATLVRAGGLNLLFDAGRGVLMRLAGAGVLPFQLDAVFLTHLHSDHVTDFNDVMTMNWAGRLDTDPLGVVGPDGTAEFCELTKASLHRDIGWRIAHHATLNTGPRFDVTEVLDGPAFERDGVRVVAAATHHPPVEPSIGFRIEHGGKGVVIGGDSLPCEGLDRLCAGANVYVQTVLRRPLVEQIAHPRIQDILTYHSSTEDAARTAAKAGVGTLVFTHMMPAPARGTEQDWIDDAKAHFDGDVLVGTDLQTIEV